MFYPPLLSLFFAKGTTGVVCMPFLPIGFFSLSPLAFFFCLFFVSSIVHLDGFLFYGFIRGVGVAIGR